MSKPREDELDADALVQLGLTRDAAYSDLYTHALQHHQIEVRIAAVRALGWLRQPSIAGLLLPMLSDTDETVRRWAASSLALCGHTEIAPQIRDYMTDETVPTVKASLARTLGWLGDKGSIEHLKRCVVHDSCGQVRGACLQALIRLSDGLDVAFLLAACQDSDAAVRIQALRGLAQGPSKTTEATLQDCAFDLDPEVRVFAIKALVSTGASGAQKHCLLALKDSNPGVRCAGLIGLRDGDFPLDESSFEHCLQDSHPEVRQQAALTKSVLEISRVEKNQR